VDAPTEPDILLYFDGACVAQLVLDDVQTEYPWYTCTIVEAPAMLDWREFAIALHSADLEFDYCPYHPDEGGYEDTDLAAYVEFVKAVRRSAPPSDETGWLEVLPSMDPGWLDRYLQFLDFRRWRAVNRSDEIVVGIPLPPSLDLTGGRFAYRPVTSQALE
jgi:hypothetical protein